MGVGMFRRHRTAAAVRLSRAAAPAPLAPAAAVAEPTEAPAPVELVAIKDSPVASKKAGPRG